MKTDLTRGLMLIAPVTALILIGNSAALAAAEPVNVSLAVNSSPVMTTLWSVLTLILVDTVMGILVSLKRGQFNLRKLPQFLSTNVLPYIGGLFVLAVTAGGNEQLAAIFYAAAATAGTKYVIEIKDKVMLLFGKDTPSP